MGYYTRYDLSVQSNGQYNSYDVAKYISEQNEQSDKFYAFEYSLKEFLTDLDNLAGTVYALELESDDECKWYDHEKEIKELSRKFPEIIFKLHGEGEENGDVWDKYFRDGKMQVCNAEMSIPPFDESKLL